MVVLCGLPAAASPLILRRGPRRGAKAVEKPSRTPADQAEAPGARLSTRHVRAYVDRDYVVQSQVLGVGINGSVRLAARRADGARRAVKRLVKDGLSARQLEQLRAEAETHLALDHPHVVRTEAVYDSQTETTFVLPCLEGGDVFDRVVEAGRYEERDAATLLRQMLLAVNYLHGQGIVHCDIKPENFVHEDRSSLNVQLVDFGHAERCVLGKRLARSGTLLYSAPEALEKSFGFAADLWSLGVVAHVLLCGQLPWRNGSDADTARSILSLVPHYSEKTFAPLSDGAKHFVRSLLCHESTRPSARGCLRSPWLLALLPERRASAGLELLAPLRGFAEASALRRACALAAAGAVADRRSGASRDLFLDLDREGRGYLLYKDFRAAFPESAVEDAELRALFDAVDQSSSPGISYTEFLAAWQRLRGCCDAAAPEAASTAEDSGDGADCKLVAGAAAYGAWRCSSDRSTEAPTAGMRTFSALPELGLPAAPVHPVPSSESLFSLGFWRAGSDDALDGSNAYMF